MKKVIVLVSMISLSACVMGSSNDGYNVKDVWEDDGMVYARADAHEKSESLCFNKAQMYAREKISNYLVNKYQGEETLKINEANEQYASTRSNKTESLMHGSQYSIKPYDKKTRTCGVELRIPKDESVALINED